MPAPSAVYNPNAPRPVEVFHLSDAANAAIPEDIRQKFHCDDQGHVLFFSAPPVDYIPPSTQKLGHSLKYLAAKEEHRSKVEERKRKLADDQKTRDDDAKRHRADLETALASRAEVLAGDAIQTLVKRIVSGNEILNDSLRNGQNKGAVDIGAMHQRGLLASRAKEQTQQIQDQSTTEGLVNLKGTAVYLDES
jgi:chromatin structure-remodeling complex subunit RSC1/2